MWRGVECGRSCHQRSTPPVKSRSSRIPGLDPVLMGRPNTWRMATADVVVRRRGLVLVCWAAALAVLAPHAVGAERGLETAARVDGSESARVEAELASRFRAPFARYALLVVRGASPLTPAGRELGDSIREAVAAVPGVAAVRGYRDARDTLLLGRDSSGTFVLVGPDAAAGRPDAIVPQLRAASAVLARRPVGRFPKLELRWTGETVLNADLRQASRASARVAERRALPLTLALLLVAFGSLIAAGTPVVSGVLVIVLALGASGMLAARWPLSILVQTFVPMIGLGLGIDYALLSVSRFPGSLARGGWAARPAGVAGDAPAVGAATRRRMAPAAARVGRRAARLGEDGARGGAANRPRHPGASRRSGRAEPCRVAGGPAPPEPPGPGPTRVGHAVLRDVPVRPADIAARRVYSGVRRASLVPGRGSPGRAARRHPTRGCRGARRDRAGARAPGRRPCRRHRPLRGPPAGRRPAGLTRRLRRRRPSPLSFSSRACARRHAGGVVPGIPVGARSPQGGVSQPVVGGRRVRRGSARVPGRHRCGVTRPRGAARCRLYHHPHAGLLHGVRAQHGLRDLPGCSGGGGAAFRAGRARRALGCSGTDRPRYHERRSRDGCRVRGIHAGGLPGDADPGARACGERRARRDGGAGRDRPGVARSGGSVELVAGPARGGPMKIEKIRLTPPPGWRRDPPRQWLSQPYPWREAAWWVAKTLFGPSRAHAGLATRLDQNVCTEAITTRMTVGFLGDIMPLGARQFVVDDSVTAFFAGVNLLVGNLEGTVIDGRAPSRFMGQAHTRATIDLLADLFRPERTLLTCANNHAGEYGWAPAAESQRILEARGFGVVGRADEPAALVDGRVLIAVGTDWTNRRCGYAARLETLERLAEVDAALRIACPHWGYGLEANPRPPQVVRSEERRVGKGWRWGWR